MGEPEDVRAGHEAMVSAGGGSDAVTGEPLIADAQPGSEPREPKRRSRMVGVSTVVGAVIGLLAAGFVVRTLVSEWDKVRHDLGHASLTWLGAGLVLAAAGMTSIAWCWRYAMRLLGASAPPGKVVAWYFVGESGKYLPGGVWPVLGRGELARRGGLARSTAYASVGLSLAVLYLAGMFVCVGFLPFALSGGGASPWMLFLVALPAGLVLLHHRVLEWLAGLARRITKRSLVVEIPDWKRSVALVVRYVPSWLFIGGATYAVSRSLTSDVSLPRVMFAATLSWVAGFLAVPVPAGAGVREAVFLAASGLDGGIAATVAVATRVLFIVVDGGGAAIGLSSVGLPRRRRSRVSGTAVHPGA
ncbi:MAG: flippase-like domain-containing protein [Actinomycetota bacterium]|nr:flippase-like domain-containing protein [Actinomycetota bacterium]